MCRTYGAFHISNSQRSRAGLDCAAPTALLQARVGRSSAAPLQTAIRRRDALKRAPTPERIHRVKRGSA